MSALTFINARMRGTKAETLRVDGGRIDAIGCGPQGGDRVVDLCGDLLLPGLINAHDHLQLNSLPSPRFARQYVHVREWIDDIAGLRRSDALFEAGAMAPRGQRLLIGGVKNLLSGVTTVAHHDPFYPELSAGEFPVDVVACYGWSHSLYLDGETKVRASWRETPADWPWIIHAAEGVDEHAANEFERLDALGCLAGNTVLVHGIALGRTQQARMVTAGAGLVWCPSSNLNLFGRTADVGLLLEAGRLAIGTDSRLSGLRDLLEELRIASGVAGLQPQALEMLATTAAARILRLPDRGALQAGMRADLLVLPAARPLSCASRSDVRLVLVNGEARYGEEDCVDMTADDIGRWTRVRVDGQDKWLDSGIVRQLQEAVVREPGLELPARTWRAA